jgi:hypothetical protein
MSQKSISKVFQKSKCLKKCLKSVRKTSQKVKISIKNTNYKAWKSLENGGFADVNLHKSVSKGVPFETLAQQYLI